MFMHLLFNTRNAFSDSALECHEKLIYFVPHKLTNGRSLFCSRLWLSSGQVSSAVYFKAKATMRRIRRMRNALMRRLFGGP